MFCGKCGFKNDDDAEFCAQCGEKIDISTDIRATLINENDISSKNKKVGKIVVFLMFVAVLIIVTSIVRSNNYRSVIKTYIKASFEWDKYDTDSEIEEETEFRNRLAVYSDYDNLSVRKGSSITLGACLIEDGEITEDVSGITFVIENPSILEMKDLPMANGMMEME